MMEHDGPADIAESEVRGIGGEEDFDGEGEALNVDEAKHGRIEDEETPSDKLEDEGDAVGHGAGSLRLVRLGVPEMKGSRRESEVHHVTEPVRTYQ